MSAMGGKRTLELAEAHRLQRRARQTPPPAFMPYQTKTTNVANISTTAAMTTARDFGAAHNIIAGMSDPKTKRAIEMYRYQNS